MTEPQGSRVTAAYFVSAILGIAAVAGLIVLLSESDNQESDAGAFAPRYEGLEERRLAAGVPTMAEGGGEHFHAQLRLFAQGVEITMPSSIGIDPAKPPSMMAGLHTHDTSGTIHNEAGTGATLGQFFEIWGVEFSSSRLGPYQANGENRLRMWVAGEPSREFGALKLADGQQIVVSFGTQDQTPAGLGSS